MPVALTKAMTVVAVVLTGQPVRAPSESVREYVAQRAAPAPVVDGKLDDAAWRGAPWTEPFVDIVGDARPAPRLLTRAKILWDDDYLYVGADLQEPDVWATLTQPDDTVWHDDDFEVFLDPDGDGLAYYEMEINALGTILDLFVPRPYRAGGKADLSWGVRGVRSAVAVRGTLNDPSDRDAGWSVEFAIPWRGLVPPDVTEAGPASTRLPGASGAGRAPRPGDRWRVNFSRVEWPMEVVDGAYRKTPRAPGQRHPEDNWVWSPQGEVNMHVPSKWGWVRFVGEPAGAGG
ncbi:MAG: carbohydrate-binding family 9-like protein [Gemmatimonadetes bacterium]|nr:carbohydrate-binding family 9-like protein [Gemmatimonadota bacterium]